MGICKSVLSVLCAVKEHQADFIDSMAILDKVMKRNSLGGLACFQVSSELIL
jgi:hypothetical protein